MKNLKLALKAFILVFKYNGYYNLDLYLSKLIAWWLSEVKNSVGIPSRIVYEEGSLEKAEKKHKEYIDTMINDFNDYGIDTDIDEAVKILAKYFGSFWI